MPNYKIYPVTICECCDRDSNSFMIYFNNENEFNKTLCTDCLIEKIKEKRKFDNSEYHLLASGDATKINLAFNNPIGLFIYRFIDIYGNELYIGKTKNLFNRIKNHQQDRSWFELVNTIKVLNIENETLMNICEIYFINKYKPIYNIRDANYDDDLSLISLGDHKFEDYIYYETKKINIPINNYDKAFTLLKENKLI